ncbi:MAG: hypothetical protein H0W88_07810 [Parachlamydiaceae bacterium]|nr:hypothetical protein [Parachlamydiaceae bacterium]
MQPQVTSDSFNMRTSILSPSDAVIGHIMSFLPPKAVGKILSTCSELRARMLPNETIWRNIATQMKIPRQISQLSWKETVLLDSFWVWGSVFKETKIKLQVNTPPNVPQLCEEGPKRVFHFYNKNAVESHDLNRVVDNKADNNEKMTQLFYSLVDQPKKDQANTVYFNDGDKVINVGLGFLSQTNMNGEKENTTQIGICDKSGKIERSFKILNCLPISMIKIRRNTIFLCVTDSKYPVYPDYYFHELPKDLTEITFANFTCIRGSCYLESQTHITIFQQKKTYVYDLDEQRKSKLELKDLAQIPFPSKTTDGWYTMAHQKLIVNDVMVCLGVFSGLFGFDLKTHKVIWRNEFFLKENTPKLIPSNDGSHIFAIARDSKEDPDKKGLLFILNALTGKDIGMKQIDDINETDKTIILSYNSIGYLDKNGNFVFKEFSLPPDIVIDKDNRSIEEPEAPSTIENQEMTLVDPQMSQKQNIVQKHKKIKKITPKSTFFNNIKNIAKWGLLAFTVFAIIKALYILKKDQKFRLIK